MFRLVNTRLLRLISLPVFLFGVRASAQFEVSPDHFDSPAQKQMAKKPGQAKARTSASAAPATPAAATAPATAHKQIARKSTRSAPATRGLTAQTASALAPR